MNETLFGKPRIETFVSNAHDSADLREILFQLLVALKGVGLELFDSLKLSAGDDIASIPHYSDAE